MKSFVSFLMGLAVFLVFSPTLSAAQLAVPQFIPLDLISFLPVIHGQIPANRILMPSQSVPAWKLSWDLARVAARQDDYDTAIARYMEVLSLKDNLIQARWELTILFLQQEKWDKATEQVGRLLAADTDNKLYIFVKAVLAQKDGEFGYSLDLFKRGAGGGNLDDLFIMSGRVNAYFALGNYEDCLALLQKLIQNKPEDERLIFNFSVLAFRLKRYGLVGEHIDALAAQSDSAPLLLMAARVYGKLNQPKKAAGYWQQLLVLRPGNIEAGEYLAKYYAAHGDEIKAIACLLALREQAARKTIYDKRIALAYLQAGEFDKAHLYLEQYLRENPNDIDSVRAMIKIHAAKGEKDATLSALEHYFSIESRPAKGNLQQAAQLYSEGGLFREAIPIYRRLLDMTPDDPKLMWALAQTLLSSGEEEEALTAWQELADVAPDAIEVYRPMAALLERLGRKGELLEVLTIINGLDPADQTVIFKLAGLYFDRHDFSRVMVFLNQFSETQRQRAEFFRWRGTVLVQKKEFVKALEDFEVLLGLEPDLGDIRLDCVRLAGWVDNLQAVEQHVAYLEQHAPQLDRPSKIVVARAFFDSGDFSRAEERYRDVVDGFVLDGAIKSPVNTQTDKAMANRYLTVANNEIAFAAFQGLAELLRVEELPYEAGEVLRQGLAFNGDIRFVNELFDLALGNGKVGEAKGWLDYLLRFSDKKQWSSLMAQGRYLAVQGEAALAESIAHRLFLILKDDWLVKSKSLSQKWLSRKFDQQGRRLLPESYYPSLVRRAFELIDLDISVHNYREAAELCHIILAGDSSIIEASVFANTIYEESGGRFGNQFQLQLEGMVPSRLLAYENFCWQHQMFEELGRVAVYMRNNVPLSLRSSQFLAVAKVKLARPNEAIVLYEELIRDNPGRDDLLVCLAKLYFASGRVDKSAEIVAQLQMGASRGDLVLLKARISWLKHDWQKSIGIYEEYLQPPVEDILHRTAKIYKVSLPVVENKRTFLEKIGLAPYHVSGLVDKVMAPEFTQIGWQTPNKGLAPGGPNLIPPGRGENSPKGFSMAVARLYARFCWQKKFAAELKIRRAVKGREYVLAAKEYEIFIKKNPQESHLLYDLAGVYSRLGRLGDEAALYEQLQARDVDYPGLEDAIHRNRLKQKPFVSAEYGYQQDDGWDGQKNMRRNWFATRMWYSLGIQENLEVSASTLKYESITADETLRAKRLFASYNSSFWQGINTTFGAGVHILADGDEAFLFKGGVTGKFGDKLSGRVSFVRDVVADTVTSISREIVQNRLETGVAIDIVPRLELAADYSYIDYSDQNWTTAYDLRAGYILFSEPTFLKINYSFDYRDSEDGGAVARNAIEDFQPGDHPYWAPKNYWKNSFGLFFKHTFGKNTLERQAPRYYTAEYYLGHFSDGYSFQTLKMTGFMEFSTTFFATLSGEINSSQPYTKKELVLSLSYRW